MSKIPLQTALALLYQVEINAGVSSFYNVGFHAWIDDKFNGFKAEADFDVSQLEEVGAWLILEALRGRNHLRHLYI